jgi:hypothetical protein
MAPHFTKSQMQGITTRIGGIYTVSYTLNLISFYTIHMFINLFFYFLNRYCFNFQMSRQSFEYLLKRKDQVILSLQGDLQESESQYMVILQAHMEAVDKILCKPI